MTTTANTVDPLIIVSADDHVMPLPEAFRQYLPSKYHSDLDKLIAKQEKMTEVNGWFRSIPDDVAKVVDASGRIALGGHLTGGYDMDVRLREMDYEGVAASILHPGTTEAVSPFFTSNNGVTAPDLKMAGAQAYHRWTADFMSRSGGRMFGVADPGPCLDMDETIRELRWVAANGFISVSAPGIVGGTELPPLSDLYYEPFWDAVDELGLVVSFHAGWGIVQGTVGKWFRALMKEIPQEIRDTMGTGGPGEVDMVNEVLNRVTNEVLVKQGVRHPFSLDLGPRQALWQMMLGGVFDRHPSLKVALTELRADWIPGTLTYLDAKFKDLNLGLKLLPSEYYGVHCAVTPSAPHKVEVQMRHQLGLNKLMLGIDFPHPESTWPNTWDWIRDSCQGVPLNELRPFVGENAINFYNLDRDKLSAVAAKIAPNAADLQHLDAPLPETLIAHFHKRSGYLKPVPELDTEGMDVRFVDDIATVTAGVEVNG